MIHSCKLANKMFQFMLQTREGEESMVDSDSVSS